MGPHTRILTADESLDLDHLCAGEHSPPGSNNESGNSSTSAEDGDSNLQAGCSSFSSSWMERARTFNGVPAPASLVAAGDQGEDLAKLVCATLTVRVDS